MKDHRCRRMDTTKNNSTHFDKWCSDLHDCKGLGRQDMEVSTGGDPLTARVIRVASYQWVKSSMMHNGHLLDTKQ